jgi:hypothetical protein
MRAQLISWRDEGGAVQDEWCSRSSDAVAMTRMRGSVVNSAETGIVRLKQASRKSRSRLARRCEARPPCRVQMAEAAVPRNLFTTSFGLSPDCGRRRERQQRNEVQLPRVPRLDDRRFGSLSARPRAGTPANLIYSPQRGLSGISVLSRSCDGRKLNGEKAVILRMSAGVALRRAGDARRKAGPISFGRPKG